MPWKASSVMEERLRFVARLLDGEAMTDVCRDYGVSRKTGYKIFDRYKEHGLEALTDRSRRPTHRNFPPCIAPNEQCGWVSENLRSDLVLRRRGMRHPIEDRL